MLEKTSSSRTLLPGERWPSNQRERRAQGLRRGKPEAEKGQRMKMTVFPGDDQQLDGIRTGCLFRQAPCAVFSITIRRDTDNGHGFTHDEN